MYKLRGVLAAAGAAFLLTGCMGGSTPQEMVYNTLEDTVKKEEALKETQEPLTKLEEEEQALFDKAISMSMEEIEEIRKIADQALENISEREALINEESEAMADAKEAFQAVESSIEEIEDEELRKEAEDLSSLMNERFEAHSAMADSYLQSLSSDKELYELLKKEDLTMEELQAQIEKVNANYETTMEHNQTYNQLTEEVNGSKVSFYENAEIDIDSEA
ncbi:YkyA family protein [Rossellomorea vietnamensis]|uniref:YkyA family protein n=1 Tax=Rossellomorea vietnamensis TaxID=218284 RepID=UPI003CF653D7